ncbi:MAG: hypothetical protein LLF76_01620 [Planctomycetaceae bacterium]|nr:hypothetical protein [Planctomycetaceae bacterium]
MSKRAFSLEDSSCPLDQAGAKTIGLLRLLRSGLAVPPAFCISAQAYRVHLKSIHLPSATEISHLEHIQKEILELPMDSELMTQIEERYRSLSAPIVAVRSSATAEDLPEHSFAGQYETFLNIANLSQCLEAVKKCWASVWSKRAFYYRQRNGIEHQSVAMAVIVQTQVNADCAGVMFTADPVTGDIGRIVIESCPGLGDKLVSGTVQPDRFVFDKSGPVQISFAAASPDARSSLLPALAASLAEAAVEIEKAFGGPQDIEWAIENGKVFFLQSRPITTLRIRAGNASDPIAPSAVPACLSCRSRSMLERLHKEKTWEDRQVWTNMNTGEILPDVVTPLTWSILERLWKPLFRSVWRMLGADLNDHVIAGLVAGRVYFNVNTGMATGRHFPRFIQRKLGADDLLGGQLMAEMRAGQIKFENDDLPDVKGSLWKLFRRIPETLWRFYRHRFSRNMSCLEALSLADRRLRALKLDALPENELCALVHGTIEQELMKLDLLFVGLSLGYYPFVRHFCQKKFGDANALLLHRLIRGQEGIDDVQAGFDLWNLAAAVSRSEFLKSRIQSTVDYDEFIASINGSAEEETFMPLWKRFMETHGHHCRGEVELYNPRWCEQPDYILGLVKNYLAGMDTMKPVENWRQLETQQAQLMRQCLSQLRNPFDRWLFRHMVEKTRLGVKLRENWKSGLVRILVHLRRIVLEMGRRLHAGAILEHPDDIFFMTLEEIRPADQYDRGDDLRQRISDRRLEYERNKLFSPPHLVIGSYRGQPAEEPVVSDTRVLKGLTASPGIVRGKARVILHADDDQQVLAGEILVAPFTDPAWTPYFMTAAGIVMDMGGVLSHGSIVAREYGIPAVVNVGPATRLIRTGQRIEVDANQALVRILD